MIYFESSRLVFRDWRPHDRIDFRAMNRDPRVMAFFTKTLNDQETDAFYQVIQDEFTQLGYGLFAVETQEDGQFIGFIGFHRAIFPAAFTPCLEIGWRLKHDVWGQGLATEGALACLRYGFEQLEINDIYSFTSKINTRSERVMQKIGLTKIAEFQHPSIAAGHPLRDHVLYHISTNRRMTK